MRPVCTACQREMTCLRTGAAVVEMVKVTPDRDEPYRLWHGDRFGCLNCGSEVVVGFGAAPVADHSDGEHLRRVIAHEESKNPPVVRVYDAPRR